MIKKNLSIKLTFLIGLFSVIIGLYFFTEYDILNLSVNRIGAVKIAEKFLKSQGYNLDKFKVESFVHYDNNIITHLLKELPINKLKEINNKKDWPSYGWNIIYHQDLPPDSPQEYFVVRVAHNGHIISFERGIPDTLNIGAVTESVADSLIGDFIFNELSIKLSEYNLIKTEEDNFKTRKDYTYIWEKEATELEGILRITGIIQGNRPGKINFEFIPKGNYVNQQGKLALLFIFSVVVVFFLGQYSIYQFLKKYHQGEIWIKYGNTIFILFFIISIISLINDLPSVGNFIILGTNITTKKIIVFLAQALLINFFLSLLVFTSWSVGESYARELFPNKLKATDAFFMGKFFSVSSGTALFNGFLLASLFFIAYQIMEIVINKLIPGIQLLPATILENYNGYIPSVSAVSNALIKSILSSIAITFFVVTLSYNKWKNELLSKIIAGFAYLFGFIIVNIPPEISSNILDFIFIFIQGFIFAHILLKTDVLTILSLHFSLYLLRYFFVFFESGNEYYFLNSFFIAFILLLIPIIYLISIKRNEEFIFENYGLPDHIKKISERERLKRELEIAGKVQLSLLPKEQPQIPGYDIYGISIPAIEAGGDYFDFITLKDNKIGIALGDVSGKGVGAAFYMTLTKGILQANAEENSSPAKILTKVNRLLYKTIEKNTFVSMFYAILDSTKNNLIFSRAGHNPALFYEQETDEVAFLQTSGIALGLEKGTIFENSISESVVDVKTGDIILFYTDGISEAMNISREEMGTAKLINILKNQKNKNAKGICEIIVKETLKHTGNFPQHDDMTIVVLKRCSNTK